MCRLLMTHIVCKCPHQNEPICPHHNNLQKNQSPRPNSREWPIRNPGADGRYDWFVRSPEEEQSCDGWSPYEIKWEPCATYLSKPEHWREDGTLVRWLEATCAETARHKLRGGIDGHHKKSTIRLLCSMCVRGHDGDDQSSSVEGGDVNKERVRSHDRTDILAQDGDGTEFLASVLNSDITVGTPGRRAEMCCDSSSEEETRKEEETKREEETKKEQGTKEEEQVKEEQVKEEADSPTTKEGDHDDEKELYQCLGKLKLE